MAHYLVVAHRTLIGPAVTDEVRRRIDDAAQTGGPAHHFHLVVPVRHPTDHRWSQGEVEEAARQRLDEALQRFREMGADVDGEVGDVDPVTALVTAERAARLAGDPYDEVLLSTLPQGVSRWLGLDSVSRAKARVNIPVTHLVAERVLT